MEEPNRKQIEEKEKLLQEKYAKLIQARWKECIDKKLQVRLIINFNDGVITSVQDQAVIMGVSVLDMYTNKVLTLDTI